MPAFCSLLLLLPSSVTCHQCFIAPAANGIENAELTIPLSIAGLNVPSDLTAKYPHLYGCTHLALDEQMMKRVCSVCNTTVWDCRLGAHGCRLGLTHIHTHVIVAAPAVLSWFVAVKSQLPRLPLIQHSMPAVAL